MEKKIETQAVKLLIEAIKKNLLKEIIKEQQKLKKLMRMIQYRMNENLITTVTI